MLDARRASDGSFVFLKKISHSVHPYEIDISIYFSTEPRASDPRNHCVPIYEVLDVPDESDVKVLVMPLLRKFDDPRLETVGEAVEFFRQVFEVCLRSTCILRVLFIDRTRRACSSCMNIMLLTGQHI